MTIFLDNCHNCRILIEIPESVSMFLLARSQVNWIKYMATNTQTPEDALEAGLQYARSTLRDLAENRGHKFGLSISEFKTAVLKPCAFCGSRPNHRVTTGHSRSTLVLINAYKEYEPDNVLPSCRSCALLRNQFNDLRFAAVTKIWSVLKKFKSEKA